MLHAPFFEAGQPQAWKYGAFGTQLAAQMFQAFNVKGLQYQEYGQLEKWMSNSSMKIFQDRVKCLKNQMSKPSNKIKKLNPTLWGDEVLTDVGGVKLAFQVTNPGLLFLTLRYVVTCYTSNIIFLWTSTFTTSGNFLTNFNCFLFLL
ncbi:endothelin-converting enzyme homolog [Limulus polyphemus]|uniref:Endothelin-converting enzyme homolog n=1 Tax=Limulus polyphemus TaxID=6850 RepID=A0ABM1RYR8_LIMPO|nr:endothelin-converting enzyme homolog [Limulus polyphemus]